MSSAAGETVARGQRTTGRTLARRSRAPRPRKILLVEDDEGTAEYVINGLKQNGYVVDHATTGRDGLLHALEGSYSVIILDRMLPELDGLSVLNSLRSAGIQTPTIILSALGSTGERVKGLEAGSDDYLVKPFAFCELLARIEVLQRRSTGTTGPAPTILTSGDLSIDLLSHRVERNGQRIDLQPREFRLLAFLMMNEGTVVTRTMMLEEVWEYHFDPHTNVIDALISRIRKKIDLPGIAPLIKTVRGVGYILGDLD
jgi:two-component system OmpR family response regulator